MSELDVKCKEVRGLKREIELLAAELLTAESKVDNLNTSFKDKSMECFKLEDELNSRCQSLQVQLRTMKLTM